MKISSFAGVLATTLLPAATVAAQTSEPSCPPGAYCEQQPTDAPEEPAEGSDGRTIVIPPAPPGADPNAPRVVVIQPDSEHGPGQVIVYENGSAPPHVLGGPGRSAEPFGPVPPAPAPLEERRYKRHRPWGMSLRVDGLILPRYRHDVDQTGMGGLGLSLKYRPVPAFAVDVSADFLGGVDSNGLDRQEVPFALSAYVYPNPRDLVQFYAFGGLNWAYARVFSDDFQSNLAEGTQDEYAYFGGHAGAGVEFRVSKLIGLDIDGMVTVRTRTDEDGMDRFPEFFDPDTGEGANASLSGAIRGGLTFWW